MLHPLRTLVRELLSHFYFCSLDQTLLWALMLLKGRLGNVVFTVGGHTPTEYWVSIRGKEWKTGYQETTRNVCHHVVESADREPDCLGLPLLLSKAV